MNRLFALVLGLCLLAATALPASAQLPVRPWIGVGGGWSSHSMDEVNDLLEQTGQDLGFELEKVESGWNVQGSVGVKFLKLGAALHYERLFVGSDNEQLGMSTALGLDGSAFYGTLDYYLPGVPLVSWGLGAGLGTLSTSDDFEPDESSGSSGGEVDGDTTLFQLHAFAEVGKGIFLRPMVGYRWAKIDDATIGGQPLGTEIDYSGVFLRLSVCMGF